MKGFIACCLAMAERAVTAPLKSPIHFAFSYDEEIGCVGVRRLLDLLKDAPIRPRLCIVGEPTLMQAVTAHKGKLGFRVTAHGLEVHSSLAPIGVNAIYMAADLIAAIRTLQKDIAERGARDGDYEVAYTTLHVGKMQGGEVMNIVPNRCTFDFEIRYLPEDDPDAFIARVEAHAQTLLPEMRAVFPDAAIRIEPRSEFPGLSTPDDADVVVLAKGLAGRNATEKVSFGTEAGLFSEIGIPTIVCGPGSIEQAHKPNEFIALEQIAKCEEFLGRLADRLTV